MCYKGQRKLGNSLTKDMILYDDNMEEILESWEKFFEPQYKQQITEEGENILLINNNKSIEEISGNEFEKSVLHASNERNPIILQMYEKSCFLCFLMRPFVNQISCILQKEQGRDHRDDDDDHIDHQRRPSILPKFKRLDIEENDFPENCPIVRGTPTFILFRGPEKNPIRFEEFKPRDFVKRLCKEFNITQEIEKSMYNLVDKVAMRFQLFSGIIMWHTESEKILDMISFHDHGHHHPTIPFDLKSNTEDKDKEIFNKYVSELMSEDMLKNDNLDENLLVLKKELMHAEMHAITMAQTLAQKILYQQQQMRQNDS